MWYRKNLPGWESWLRVVIGIAAVAWGTMHFLQSHRGLGIAMGGLALALTGLIGYCPVCRIAGRRPVDSGA